MITSALFKAKARAVLQNHWQTALLIALIVNLPTLLVQGIGAFTHNDLLTRVEDLMLDAAYSTAAMESLPASVRALFSETGILIVLGLNVLAWLITPVLSLGMNHWTLDRIRGEEEPVTTVFSRLRIFLKGIGLRLWIALNILLWMLPGITATVLAMLPLMNADPTDAQAVSSAMNTSSLLIWFGMTLMVVLGVIGYLRFAMADFILADEPEERVLSCARRSKMLMKGRSGALAMLLLSFLMWYLLIIFVTSIIAGIAGDIIALVIQMLGSLFLSVYMLTSQGVFYEALRMTKDAPLQPQSPEDAGIS